IFCPGMVGGACGCFLDCLVSAAASSLSVICATDEVLIEPGGFFIHRLDPVFAFLLLTEFHFQQHNGEVVNLFCEHVHFNLAAGWSVVLL
ncbi:hypothetical protein ACFL6N_06890, partial [Thermodesulfobacteriota bacterium]